MLGTTLAGIRGLTEVSGSINPTRTRPRMGAIIPLIIGMMEWIWK